MKNYTLKEIVESRLEKIIPELAIVKKKDIVNYDSWKNQSMQKAKNNIRKGDYTKAIQIYLNVFVNAVPNERIIIHNKIKHLIYNVVMHENDVQPYLYYLKETKESLTNIELLKFSNAYMTLWEKKGEEKYFNIACKIASTSKDVAESFRHKYKRQIKINISHLLNTEERQAILEYPEILQYYGVTMGLAIGDALGGPLEFLTSTQIIEQYPNYTGYVAGGVHNLEPGEYTDDTQQSILILRNLVENPDFEPEIFAEDLVKWKESHPKDIGHLTSLSISYLKRGYKWNIAGKKAFEKLNTSGNGSLMRCTPIALRYYYDDEKLYEYSMKSSIVTHSDQKCIDSCYILNHLIAKGLMRTPIKTPEELIESISKKVNNNEILNSISNLKINNYDNNGYVVNTLCIALKEYFCSSDFQKSLLCVIKLGGDTDTNAAVTGAILGLKCWYDRFPVELRKNLKKKKIILELTEKLHNKICKKIKNAKKSNNPVF